jgi:aminoglycoside phosphotransferase (APT) family kinase protein
MAIFRIGDDLAARLPRHAGSVGSLEAEVRWVSQLSGRWTFPTQRVIRVGTPGPGYPWGWAITSWLPGELAAHRPLDPSSALEVGRALAEIHRPAPADAPFNSEQSVELAAREPMLEALLQRLPDAGSRRGFEFDRFAAAALWQRARAAPDDAPRVWIHADLHPFNVVSQEGRFGGIIDWSDVAGGDAAVDLGFVRLLLPADVIRAVHAAYGGVDEATAARADGIGLTKAATLALLDDEAAAAVGWRALVELRVARSMARP